LGDQPHLRAATLQELLQSVLQQPEAVWQPARGGSLRHPVALPKAVFERLRQTKAADLKSFLTSLPEPRRSVEVDDPGLDLDIDTPADYDAALKLAGLV
jgi:molybdenum cofactor cytidylyltransferase